MNTTEQHPTIANFPPLPPGHYNGPFPRARHSHLCLTCQRRGHRRTACYKTKCTKPSKVLSCQFCR